MSLHDYLGLIRQAIEKVEGIKNGRWEGAKV